MYLISYYSRCGYQAYFEKSTEVQLRLDTIHKKTANFYFKKLAVSFNSF